MRKRFFEEEAEIYCIRCGNELNKTEIFSGTGLCTQCARKVKEEKGRRRQRQKDYSEFELEEGEE